MSRWFYIYYTTVPDSVMRYAYPSEYIYIPAVYIMSRLATIKGDFLTRVKFMIFGLAEVASFNNIEECLWKEPISSEKPIPRTNIVIRFGANVRVAYAAGTSIELLIIIFSHVMCFTKLKSFINIHFTLLFPILKLWKLTFIWIIFKYSFTRGTEIEPDVNSADEWDDAV